MESATLSSRKPNGADKTTKTLPDTREERLAVWLHRFDRLCPDAKRVLNDELVSLYDVALSELSDAQLEAACRLTVKTCKFFPKPAEILEHVQTANNNALDAEAEERWQYVRRYAAKYVLPDSGLASDAPSLDAATEKAASAAGGLRWLESCPVERIEWARRTFLENYKRLRNLPAQELLVSNGEAKKILAQLATPKQLPAVVRAVSAQPVVPPRKVPKKPETAPVELCEEEWQRRKDEQKRRLAEHVAAKGYCKYLVPPAPVSAPSDETARG